MKRVRKVEMEEFDAIQYTGDNANKISAFVGLDTFENELDGKKCLNVSDPTGDWIIFIEQWVLKTLDGELLGTCEKQTFWDHFTTVDMDLD